MLPVVYKPTTFVYVRTNPFSLNKEDIIRVEFSRNTTLLEVVASFKGVPSEYIILRNGNICNVQDFAKPLGDDCVILTNVPKDDDPGRIMAVIAVTALAIYTGNWLVSQFNLTGFWASLAWSIVGTAATWALNKIVPPEIPELDNTKLTRRRSVTGVANRANQLGPIPKVYGTFRYYPPIAGFPYLEATSAPNDQYMTALFCLGYGPLAIAGRMFFVEDYDVANEPLGHDYYAAGDTDNWALVNATAAGQITVVQDSESPYGKAIRFVSAFLRWAIEGKDYTYVGEGQPITARARFRGEAGSGGKAYIVIRVIQPSGQIWEGEIGPFAPTTQWETYEGSLTIPIGVEGYATVAIANGPSSNDYLYFDYAELNGSALRLRALDVDDQDFTEYNLPDRTILVGETDIKDLPGFRLEICRGEDLTLYGKVVTSQEIGLEFPFDVDKEKNGPGNFVEQVWDISGSHDRISGYLVFPQGSWYSYKGKSEDFAQAFELQLSTDGGTTWYKGIYSDDYPNEFYRNKTYPFAVYGGKETLYLPFEYTDDSLKQGLVNKIKIRRSFYLIGAEIIVNGYEDFRIFAGAVWAILNLHQDKRAWNLNKAVVMALRVKASDRVYGRLDNISIQATGASIGYEPLNMGSSESITTMRAYVNALDYSEYGAPVEDDFYQLPVKKPDNTSYNYWATEDYVPALQGGDTFAMEVLVRSDGEISGFTMYFSNQPCSINRIEYIDGRTWRLYAEYTTSSNSIYNPKVTDVRDITWTPGKEGTYLQFKVPRIYNKTTLRGVRLPTSSPAWAYRDALVGDHLANPVPEDRIDDNALKNWHDWCLAGDYQCNAIFDGDDTIIQRAQLIAASGFGTFAMQDNVYTIITDIKPEYPTQVISIGNASNFQGQKNFVDVPHAVKVQYVDANTGTDDEVTVYDTDRGYHAGNARKFLTVSGPTITSYKQAWRTAMYHLRSFKLRPERWTLTMGIEQLVSHRGDVVELAYDTILVGLGSARIEGISPDGLTLTMSEPLEFSQPVGTTYGLKIRTQTGQIQTVQLSTDNGFTDTVQTTVDVTTLGVQSGDLCVFGVYTQETIPAKITEIRPNADFTANITLVDAAYDIFDFGSPAAYDPGITIPGDFSQVKPATPKITYVQSDESVMFRDADGNLRIAMIVNFTVPGSYVAIDRANVYYTDVTSKKQKVARADADEGFVRITEGIEQHRTYEIRIMVRSIFGQWSNLSDSVTHEVVGASTPPTDVTGFSYEIVPTGQIKLNWNANPEPDISGYEIRQDGTDWDTAQLVGTITGTSFIVPIDLKGQTSISSLTYRIKAFDVNNPPLYSLRDTSITIPIDGPGVTKVSSTVIDNFVLLSWEGIKGTFDIAGFKVVRGSDPAAPDKDFGIIDGTFISIFESLAGNYTYWVTPIDAVGLEGTPAQVIATVNSPPDFSLKGDFQSAFSGTTNNAYVEGSRIFMPLNVAELYGDHFTTRSWTTPQDQVNAGYPIYAQPTTSTGYYEEVFDTGAQIDSARIVVEFTYTDAAATQATVTPNIQVSQDNATWTDLGNVWEVHTNNFRYIKVRITTTSPDSKAFIIGESLSVRLFQKLKTDAGKAYYNGSTATTVNFNIQFADVTSIVVTPEYNASYPVVGVYEFNDVPNPTSFKVYLYRSDTGAPVAGWFSWTARGY